MTDIKNKALNDIEYELTDLRYLLWAKSRKSSGTAGSFLKSYDDTSGRKVYYKLSDYDPAAGIVGHECVNEIIAQRLMDHFDIPHLEYKLIHAIVKVDGHDMETYLCRSYDFKQKNESKIALEDYYEMQRTDGESPLEFIKRMGWENMIYDMLYTDFLILNRDRHGANIEVLMNWREKKVRLAPLFDQGLSLVCRCHNKEELGGFDVMEDRKVQAFIGGSSAFDNIALVPTEYLKNTGNLTDQDLDNIMTGMEKIIGREYIDKIREMIMRRWQYIDRIRNT